MEERSDRNGCLGSTVLETLIKSFQKHGRRPFLGKRTKNTNGEFGPYEWFTYKQIFDRFVSLGAGMRFLNIISPHEVICISSPNRIEWVVADFAAISCAVVTAPIHFETDLATIKYIIKHSDSRCVITDEPSKFFDAIPDCPRLETIIKMDDLTLEERERARQLNKRIYSMAEVEETGKTVLDTYQPVHRRSTDIHTIMYTSGSTGVPKGAVMTDNRWNNFISHSWYLGDPIVHISFAPLAHTMERQHISIIYPYGGRIGFYSGDISRIFEDAQELQPSFFSAPPRLWNEIYTQYKKALAVAELTVDTTGWDNWKATDYDGINYWTNTVTNESSWLSPREAFEAQVMLPFENLLGKKVSYLMTGGALTAPPVLAFMRKCFRCVVYDGYGCTETGGISNDNVINPDVDVVLEDVPELGYTKESKPHPCGQICVKTPFIISGYYKDDNATKSNFTSDGYFKTGDIGMKVTDNKIIIIDRLKSIFKLARGEFVAPEMLEGSYLLCKYISQIFIHGEVGRAFLVAIIVPNFGVLHDWLKETNEDVEDNATLCKMDKVKKKIIKELHLTAKELKLQGYEIPKAILISDEQFTTKNGLLTPSQKNKRQQIIKHYENTIKQLWQEAESEDQSMANLVNELLGIESADADTPLSVLGTDSISTVRLFAAIKEKFNKEVPVQLLAGATVNDLVNYIKSDDQPKLPLLFESDCNMTFDRNRLLQLSYSSSDVKSANAILLTGATGFLGIFLLKELLEKTEATIYCLIRAKSRDEGFAKLETKNKQSFLNMQFANRVQVVLGDLDQPSLGIDSKTYKELSEKIDIVFHCGAYVNWVLSYQALRIPNFLGTVEIANFATTNKLKPIHYVSTIGVADLEEEKLIASYFLPQINNYSLSKYVAEKYLRSSGIPLAIYRPGMITGSSTTGYSNPTDYVSRYISGIIKNKHAFASQNTIDMTPVDHVAKMIVAISLHDESIDKCFHVRSISTVSYTAIAQAVSFITPIEVTPYVTWRKTLEQLDKSNPLYDLLPFFPVDQRSLSNSDAWPYKITNAEAVLKKDKLEHLLHYKVSEEQLKVSHRERV